MFNIGLEQNGVMRIVQILEHSFVKKIVSIFYETKREQILDSKSEGVLCLLRGQTNVFRMF